MKKVQNVLEHILYLFIALFLFSHAFPAKGVPFSPSISLGNRTFALELYTRIKKAEGNIVISPFSLSAVLAMTYLGARGETQLQMEKVLNFSRGDQLHEGFWNALSYYNKDLSDNLTIANSLWGQKGYPFLKSFHKSVKRFYSGTFFTADFTKQPEDARKQINLWVRQSTLNNIPEIVEKGAIEASTTLVLCNAVHFKGEWKNSFDPSKTFFGDFMINPQKKTSVQYMAQIGSFQYFKFSEFDALLLPYSAPYLSMVILLPNPPYGLAEIEEDLSIQLFDEMMTRILSQPAEKIDVLLPKFSAAKSFELSKTLAEMGMQKAFQAADFSGMAKNSNLFIGQVLHKAVIDVNEKGTEAAGTSTVIMNRSSSQPKVFHADHPFLFFIYDEKLKTVLFMGRLSTP